MENRIKVAVDAMGGDYAPLEAVKGAVAAKRKCRSTFGWTAGYSGERIGDLYLSKRADSNYSG